MKSRLLILSISDIGADARVLKQVRAFADEYDVTTCGLGESPDERVRHLRIDPRVPSVIGRLAPYGNAVLLRLRRYRSLYWVDPLVRRARARLRGLTFDVVIANDIDTVPLALTIADGARVHADLHEYFPGLHDDVPAWVRLRKPYFDWLIRTFATKAKSVTTVGEGLAEKYEQNFGIRCGVVTNASPGMSLVPGAVERPIRLVHSGVAQTGRQLELTMRAAARTTTDVSLDLYLMPSDLAYLTELTALAAQLGDRVTVREPLGQASLVTRLNEYDLGVFVLPPTTTNNANALPNKFFDFVQARLGIIIGPSPEMARILGRYRLGITTDDFTEDALVAALDALDPVEIAAWKAASHDVAPLLAAENQITGWTDAVAAIAGARR